MTERDGYPEIYTMNVDGTGETRLTNNIAVDEQPNWSPDGTKIAFMSERDGHFEVYKMNADGSAQTRLVGSSTRDEDPVWSPDGTMIAFQTLRDGQEEIYTINPDGSNQVNRMNNPAIDAVPDWQAVPGSSPAPTYAAPKRTSPLRLSLVPVFQQCGTGAHPANGQHASPFSVPSCPSAAQGVAHFGPQANGTAWLSAIYGDTNASNGDQADLTLRFNLSDVRAAAGADYDPNGSGADGMFACACASPTVLTGPPAHLPGRQPTPTSGCHSTACRPPMPRSAPTVGSTRPLTPLLPGSSRRTRRPSFSCSACA